MNDRKESLIVVLIACIVFTPILVCAGIKGLGGLIFFWGLFCFLWWIFFGKDKWEIDKYKREIAEKQKKMRPIIEEEKKQYEKNLPNLYKQMETQRRAKGLVTDSSFKEYMKRKGFDVEGTIDIGRFPTWEEHQRGIEYVKPEYTSFNGSVLPKTSDIKIITHKSMEQLREMGITDLKQLLGDYFKYFSWSITNENGGFYKGKKEEYDNCYKLITVDDPNNMCANVFFVPTYDKNVNVQWTKNRIYHISRGVKEKWISKKDKQELDRLYPESINNVDLNNKSNMIRIVYNTYTIYRDSGVTYKEGNYSLTNNEKKFLILADNKDSIVYNDSIMLRNKNHDGNWHYQICIDKLNSDNYKLT